MRTRRPFIPQRKRIFVACEGESEQSYAGLLRDLADDAGLHIHIDAYLLGRGAGDPLARVTRVGDHLNRLRRSRGEPPHKYILLDRDQADADPHRAAQAVAMAQTIGLKMIWQDPCLEAVLLRHLPHRATHRPATTPLAMNAIIHDWPEYEKPMTSARLADRINLAGVRQVAGVEAELAELLACIGLIE